MIFQKQLQAFFKNIPARLKTKLDFFNPGEYTPNELREIHKALHTKPPAPKP